MANPKIEYTCPECKQIRLIISYTVRRRGFTGLCRQCIDHARSSVNKVFGTRLHSVWAGMKTRCLNPAASNYSYYGGRGITVCERWLKYANFHNDMSPHPGEGWSLERIDNDGPYSPENCRWATRDEQNYNTRQNHWIEFAGKKQTITQWAKEIGLDNQTLHSRIYRLGWSLDRALTKKARILRRRPR